MSYGQRMNLMTRRDDTPVPAMRDYSVLINRERHGFVTARNYCEAAKVARVQYGRRCDVIG